MLFNNGGMHMAKGKNHSMLIQNHDGHQADLGNHINMSDAQLELQRAQSFSMSPYQS